MCPPKTSFSISPNPFFSHRSLVSERHFRPSRLRSKKSIPSFNILASQKSFTVLFCASAAWQRHSTYLILVQYKCEFNTNLQLGETDQLAQQGAYWAHTRHLTPIVEAARVLRLDSASPICCISSSVDARQPTKINIP